MSTELADAATPTEHTAMRRAIALAKYGLGRTSPNPPVGCVLLDSAGQTVGEGWHHHAGGPHAEVIALTAAGEKARGGTAVVTLEPCTHTGRTGPCTEALLAAGVRRVVVALRDPNAVAAGGLDVLAAAGVDVASGVLAAEAMAVTGRWVIAVRRGRPYLIWKFASSLDGRSAAADGSSRWLTDTAAREDVHRLRASVDTILVGVGTVLADDPALTVRLPDYHGPQPRRVVIDSTGRTPAQARLLTDQAAAASWIATADQVGADEAGRVDLARLLARLYQDGSRIALLEGGPTVASAALRLGVVDQVIAYLAPKLLGSGPPAVTDMGITSISEALQLEVIDVTQLGPDLRVTANPLR